MAVLSCCDALASSSLPLPCDLAVWVSRKTSDRNCWPCSNFALLSLPGDMNAGINHPAANSNTLAISKNKDAAARRDGAAAHRSPERRVFAFSVFCRDMKWAVRGCGCQRRYDA